MMRYSPIRNSRSPRTGLTLVELVLVVLVMGILAAVAIPKYGELQGEFRVRFAAERVAADLRMARQDAIARSAPRSVIFRSAPSAGYSIPEMPHLDKSGTSYRVDLTAEPYAVLDCIADFGFSQTIIFNGHGIPNHGGRVTIVSRAGQAVVVVHPQTGAVVVL